VPVERSGGVAVGLQLERALEEGLELLARKLLSGQEMARHRGIVVGVLTWNLFHGRDFPPDPALLSWRSRLLRTTERGATHAQVNRPLREEFASWLAARPWKIALLQEAPPRWQQELASRCGASSASALTSRNSLPRLRGLIAGWNPDLIASNEGGSNQLLVRAPARIADVRRLTLAERPERRRMLWTRLELPDGRRVAVANLHATASDRAASSWEVEHAAERAVEWAGPDPLVFGGDFNVRPAENGALFDRLRDRCGLGPPTAPRALDHLLSRGLEIVDAPAALPAEQRDVPGPDGLRIRLSDHAPVAASLGMR
jgi:endonuclease/exonuclease/phosphatase family metal-dependent hydrolase